MNSFLGNDLPLKRCHSKGQPKQVSTNLFLNKTDNLKVELNVGLMLYHSQQQTVFILNVNAKIMFNDQVVSEFLKVSEQFVEKLFADISRPYIAQFQAVKNT